MLPSYNRNLNLTKLRNWKEILKLNEENLVRKYDIVKENLKSVSKDWNNKKDIIFVPKQHYVKELMLKEDNSFVPRFNLKKYQHPLFIKYPPNKELKYSEELIKTAINYGMILMIQYRGAKDKFVQGHQRVIYPMVLGRSSKNNPLLRGFHLRGWSVSGGGNLEKEWRMFRGDRILSISFTGNFFRLPPSGYNMDDKGMKGGIITAANFDIIRRKQKELIAKNIIQNQKDVDLSKQEGKTMTIQLDNTNSILDLSKPFDNPNVNKKDQKIIRISFLKSLEGNKDIAVLGALGKRDNIVKVMVGGKYQGKYKVMKATMGDGLDKPHLRKIEGRTKFNLTVFVKILSK
jgi:hypothetical protein